MAAVNDSERDLSRRDVLAALGGLASALALGDLGCGPSGTSEVVVYCSVDQVFAEPVLRAFEAASGIRVRPVFDTEEAKSTGVANRLIAEVDQSAMQAMDILKQKFYAAQEKTLKIAK